MAPLFSFYHEGLTSDNNYIIVSIHAHDGRQKKGYYNDGKKASIKNRKPEREEIEPQER